MEYLEKDFHNLKLSGSEMQAGVMNCIPKRPGPLVPPKPIKKDSVPEVPQSRNVQQACKPLYSQRLQYGLDDDDDDGVIDEPTQQTDLSLGRQPHLQRKKQSYNTLNTFDNTLSKVTLDNPAVLDQQLEVLAHHKRQLEKRGLLPNLSSTCVPKLSTTSLAKSGTGENDSFYANILPNKGHDMTTSYSNVKAQRNFFETINAHSNASDTIYSNLSCLDTNSCIDQQEDDIPAPPSPVSSSYSELRRATDVFATNKEHSQGVKNVPANGAIAQSYMNVKYNTGGNENVNYSCYSPTLQSSSTYESIYEPINPRPPSQLSSGSNYLGYSPYINNTMHSQITDRSILSNSSSLNLSSIDASHDNLSSYSSTVLGSVEHLKPEAEVEALTGYLVHSMENENDVDSFGICFKCNERVLGESSGCTAMNQIYHIQCFTCSQCQINLQGKPFYALEGKPYCEYDYLQTLEKCSVCMKPILERILRATGKPYHPQCFTCVMCKKSLDGIPFTVDATNQNYCIEDFHKKFAPRCCVCKEPIMPEPGEEETVRVVALDRSFHFECYKCEDCGLLLSSEAEGRGCYPLDDHVLCKSCNAQRVQLLTNRITTEL